MIRGVLCGLLVLATLGEGGGSPASLVVWHGGLVVLALLLSFSPARAPGLGSAGLGLALVGFLALFVVGVLRAPYGYAALLTALELAACCLVGWAACGVGPRLLDALRVWLLAAGAAQSAYVLYQWAALGARRPAGTFLNPNHLALWCVAALLLGVSHWPRPARAAGSVGAGLALGGLGLALFLTGSRGAFVGLAVGIAVLAGLRWSRLARRERAALVVLALVGLTLGGVRLAQRLGDADPFRYHRAKIWRASLQVFGESPLWGSGPGQFPMAVARFGFADGDGPLRFDRTFSTTHSDLLRLPCELGLPAALVGLVTLVLAWRVVRRRRRDPAWLAVTDGGLAALAAILTQGAFDNPSDWAAIYLLASALAGAVLSAPAAPSASRASWGLRLAAALGVLWIYLVLDVTSFAAWREARDLPRGRLDAEGARHLARAVRWNPLQPDLWRRQSAHLAGDGTDWDLEGYAAARQAAEQALRLSPRDARVWQGLAEIEARACRTLLRDEATRERAALNYARAAELEPHNPFLPIDLAKLLIDTGDPGGARRAAERALELEPEAVLPRLLLADALIEGRTSDAAARASALLDQAQERAARGAPAALNNAYSRELLRLDPLVLARLKTKLSDLRP